MNLRKDKTCLNCGYILFFVFYTGSNIRDIKEAALKRKNNHDTTASQIVRRESSQGLNIRLDTVNTGDVTGEFSFSIPDNLPETEEEYLDSVRRLPETEKPGWLENKLYLKTIRQANMSDESILSGWLSSFFHNIPKMMFILLPFAAMFLKLLYIRRKKYYIDHLIFVLHTHSWLFLILLVPYLLEYTGIISESPILILMMLFYIYHFLAMKNVYRQNIFKTAVKFLLFIGLYTFSFLVIIVVNLILTTAVI